MPRKSKLIKALKEKEIQRFKKLTPQQRLDVAVAHNDFVKLFFGLGLKTKGFSSEEISTLWKNRKH